VRASLNQWPIDLLGRRYALNGTPAATAVCCVDRASTRASTS